MAAARPAAVAVVLVLVLVLEGVMEGGWRASVAPWDVQPWRHGHALGRREGFARDTPARVVVQACRRPGA